MSFCDETMNLYVNKMELLRTFFEVKLIQRFFFRKISKHLSLPVWIPSGPISLITAASSGLRVFSIAFVVACGMWVHVVHEPNVNHLPSNVTDELKKVHFTRLLMPQAMFVRDAR